MKRTYKPIVWIFFLENPPSENSNLHIIHSGPWVRVVQLTPPSPTKMLSNPFLSRFVFLPPGCHTHLTRHGLRHAKSAERVHHLSVVYKTDGRGGQDDENRDSLVFASGKGYLETVKFLVLRGANINTNNDKALVCASENGHLEVVKFLVLRGANVHADALIFASMSGHLDVVKFLTLSGADVYARNGNALVWASGGGHLEVVKFLIGVGAWDPLESTCRHASLSIL